MKIWILLKTILISDTLILFEESVIPKAPVTMMLAIGSEKAAIMDTGLGISDSLLRHIRIYTDKPLFCLLTHCDPDHAGGATLFEDIYMSEEDDALMKASLKPMVRLKIIENLCGKKSPAYVYTKENILRKSTFSYRNITHGQQFDLGESLLETISLPGHTKGSLCFLNRKEGWVFTGDSIANMNSPVLFFEKCQPLMTYKRHLELFIKQVGDGVVIYTGHDTAPLEVHILPEILTLCDEILVGDTANDIPYLPPFMVSDKGDMGWFSKLGRKLISGMVMKKQLGDSVPLKHSKPGFTASIQYNAKNLADGIHQLN